MVKLGILHPGTMGVSVAASARNSGCQVYWASAERSLATRKRAAEHGLTEVSHLSELCAMCGVLVSVCPPHAAEQVLDEVLSCGFRGLYLDANAISPGRVGRMAEKASAMGTSFVDGGIIGGPAWTPGETWLYLSGVQAEEVARCFSAGPLECTVLGVEPGKASALKMVYAGWTKGSSAMLAAILAAAQELDVWEALQAQWNRNFPGFAEQTIQRTRRMTAKAWRFAGEMDEIAATLESTGMPAGFHQAAAQVYRRLEGLKDRQQIPELEEVLRALSSPDVQG